MPRSCCVPRCNSNYPNTVKKEGTVSTFGFPKDKQLRERWIQAIPRVDWEPTPAVGVCIKHFKESDIVKIKDFGINGKVVIGPTHRPRIKKDAIPCVFLENKYFKERIKRIEANVLIDPLEQPEDSIPCMFLDGYTINTSLPRAAHFTHMNNDFHLEYCRLCAKRCPSTELHDFSASNDESIRLFATIQQINIDIQQGDHLPQTVCNECVHLLEGVEVIIRKITNAQKTLMDIFKDKLVDVKVEFTQDSYSNNEIHTDNDHANEKGELNVKKEAADPVLFKDDGSSNSERNVAISKAKNYVNDDKIHNTESMPTVKRQRILQSASAYVKKKAVSPVSFKNYSSSNREYSNVTMSKAENYANDKKIQSTEMKKTVKEQRLVQSASTYIKKEDVGHVSFIDDSSSSSEHDIAMCITEKYGK